MGVLSRYILGDTRNLAFYDWDVKKQGPGEFDPDIVEWDAHRPLDPTTSRQHARSGPALPRWRMLWRCRRGTARLFIMMVDGFPAAFEMIQDWSLMRRELGWLERPGPYLGPGWTDPDYRGRRLCPRLLLHMIYLLGQSGVTYMYATVEQQNRPSRKMVERMGFRPMGIACVKRRFCRAFISNEWLRDESPKLENAR